MSNDLGQTCDADRTKLIQIWKTLEMLTVSLDRMGDFWLKHGEDAAKEALHQWMGPAVNEQIAQARSLVLDILEACDPAILDQLNEMAADEAAIGYWNGPT